MLANVSMECRQHSSWIYGVWAELQDLSMQCEQRSKFVGGVQ